MSWQPAGGEGLASERLGLGPVRPKFKSPRPSFLVRNRGGKGAHTEMMRNAPLAPGTVVAAAGPLWAHKPWASTPAWTASRKKLLESASTGRRGGLAAAEGSSPACLRGAH